MSKKQSCSDINQVALLRNKQPLPGSRKSLGDSSSIFSRGKIALSGQLDWEISVILSNFSNSDIPSGLPTMFHSGM